MANACNHPKVKDIPKNADGTWPRICHHCFKAGHLRSKCPDLGRKPAAAGGSYYVEVCSQDLGWVGAANLPEEDLPGEEGVSQEEILNFWRGDGGGVAKQESGDFCGWVGEIRTPIILLKDRLIGDEGGEEFLEEEKEGVSFFSPEIPRGGEQRGKILLDWWRGREKFLLLYQRGKILLEWWRGREKFLFLHQGGKVRIEEEIFRKKNFLPLLKRGVRRGREFFGKRAPRTFWGGRVTSLRGSIAQSEGGRGGGSEES